MLKLQEKNQESSARKYPCCSHPEGFSNTNYNLL